MSGTYVESEALEPFGTNPFPLLWSLRARQALVDCSCSLQVLGKSKAGPLSVSSFIQRPPPRRMRTVKIELTHAAHHPQKPPASRGSSRGVGGTRTSKRPSISQLMPWALSEWHHS